MKEKFDLSLDNRQIVSLVIAGIVVLGAVFVLGVVVGKKLGDSERAFGAPDLLSALDAKAGVTDHVRAAPTPALTFQDELVKKSPEAEPPTHKPAVVVAMPAAAPVSNKSLAAEVAKAAAPVASKPPAKPADPENDSDSDVEAEEGKPPAKPVSAPAFAEGRIQEIAVAARTATVEPTAPKPPAPMKAAPAKGGFALQLSATQTRDEATKFVAALKDKGYAPYIVEAQVPGRGTWYRVRMGDFPNKEAAGKYLQDFRRETQMEAFIASTNN